jgi:6-phosphogluconolactonase
MAEFMYVTLMGDDKVLTFTIDSKTGSLTPKGETKVPGGPAPTAISPSRRHLYIGRRGSKHISSYNIDQKTGTLTLSGAVELETDPCFISTDRKGRFVLSAYYEGAGVTIHPIGEDGLVGGPPVVRLKTARGAHCFQTDPSNRFAFVPHIAGNGPNMILQFRFDEATGRITPNSPDRVSPERPDGPRHYCFHPRLNVVYFSNEQGCSVTAYQLSPESGTLRPFQTVSTLPADFKGKNTCSQIRITPNGKFLYAPNRGHDSIAGFAVDGVSGRLTAAGHTAVERVPRAFNMDTEGRFLYSAGLETGRMGAYRIDQATGRLEQIGMYEVGQRPMWVLTTRLGESSLG